MAGKKTTAKSSAPRLYATIVNNTGLYKTVTDLSQAREILLRSFLEPNRLDESLALPSGSLLAGQLGVLKYRNSRCLYEDLVVEFGAYLHVRATSMRSFADFVITARSLLDNLRKLIREHGANSGSLDGVLSFDTQKIGKYQVDLLHTKYSFDALAKILEKMECLLSRLPTRAELFKHCMEPQSVEDSLKPYEPDMAALRACLEELPLSCLIAFFQFYRQRLVRYVHHNLANPDLKAKLLAHWQKLFDLGSALSSEESNLSYSQDIILPLVLVWSGKLGAQYFGFDITSGELPTPQFTWFKAPTSEGCVQTTQMCCIMTYLPLQVIPSTIAREPRTLLVIQREGRVEPFWVKYEDGNLTFTSTERRLPTLEDVAIGAPKLLTERFLSIVDPGAPVHPLYESCLMSDVMCHPKLLEGCFLSYITQKDAVRTFLVYKVSPEKNTAQVCYEAAIGEESGLWGSELPVDKLMQLPDPVALCLGHFARQEQWPYLICKKAQRLDASSRGLAQSEPITIPYPSPQPFIPWGQLFKEPPPARAFLAEPVSQCAP